MKKAILILLACAIFSGCATLSDRKGPDDVVFVIKVNRVFLDTAGKETKMPEKYMALHANYITVDDDPTLFLIQQDYNHVFINGLTPGAHKISSIRTRLISDAVGKISIVPVSIPFELKPGCITILDKSFNIIIRMVGVYSYSNANGFADLKDQERTDLIEKLKTYGSFKTWELAE